MVEIKKYKYGEYYCFEIYTDEGCFTIKFCGNFDLYWSYIGKDNNFNNSSKSLFIDKENYFLFKLFDELYNDIKNYNIFKPSDEKDVYTCIELNSSIMKKDLYNTEYLFKNEAVEWHSDDLPYDVASNFVIEKLDDCYRVTFNKSKNNNFPTYSVRISNSGSRYEHFNVVFMRMYQKLCEYNPDCHQIHMEEYLYNKRKVRKKETI